MPNSVPQRLGPFTRKILAHEVTRGSASGITTAVVLPMRDADGFSIGRGEVEAPFFNNSAMPFGTAPGPINAAGRTPLQLEFLASGNIFKMPFGTAGYSKTTLVTGTIHNFFIPTGVFTPISGQLQDTYGEGTPQYERAFYALVKAIAFSYANGGAAPLDVDWVASGDSAYTDLAWSVTDNLLNAVSVYNGIARLAIAALNPTWLTLAGIKNFNASIDTGATAEPVAFNDGVAGSVNPSIFTVKAMLELMMANGGSGAEADFTALNYAINRSLLYYDCEWCDASASGGPLGTAFPTKWQRLVLAGLRPDRRSTTSGGRAGITTTLNMSLVNDASFSKIAAESFGTVVGPYTIGAGTTDVFSHNIDGLGASSVTLTAGAARTAAQVVADLNANGTFLARAVADVFNGRVRVTSKQTGGSGASSSVALTAAANNANAVLGFNTTTINGFTTPLLISLYTSIATYPQ